MTVSEFAPRTMAAAGDSKAVGVAVETVTGDLRRLGNEVVRFLSSGDRCLFFDAKGGLGDVVDVVFSLLSLSFNCAVLRYLNAELEKEDEVGVVAVEEASFMVVPVSKGEPGKAREVEGRIEDDTSALLDEVGKARIID